LTASKFLQKKISTGFPLTQASVNPLLFFGVTKSSRQSKRQPYRQHWPREYSSLKI